MVASLGTRRKGLADANFASHRDSSLTRNKQMFKLPQPDGR